jgi:hypothetical protein
MARNAALSDAPRSVRPVGYGIWMPACGVLGAVCESRLPVFLRRPKHVRGTSGQPQSAEARASLDRFTLESSLALTATMGPELCQLPTYGGHWRDPSEKVVKLRSKFVPHPGKEGKHAPEENRRIVRGPWASANKWTMPVKRSPIGLVAKAQIGAP